MKTRLKYILTNDGHLFATNSLRLLQGENHSQKLTWDRIDVERLYDFKK